MGGGSDGRGHGAVPRRNFPHRQFARGPDNLILSPFSNAAALSLLLDGARGQTASQRARALHQTYPDPVHYLTASGLIDQLLGHGNERGSELTAANGLWTQRGVPLRPEYERIVVQNYHASATQQDFAGNPEQSRSAINIWTSVQTKGKIPELFAPGSLGKGTRLVLTRAVYFHGVWQAEFHEEDTRPAVFHTSAREDGLDRHDEADGLIRLRRNGFAAAGAGNEVLAFAAGL